MRRRVDVRLLRDRDGDPQRVADDAAVSLVAAREAGQDRQPGGVGGRPALGAQRVRAQVPGRAAVGVPARALALGRVELEQLAVALAQRQHVAIATALDRRVERRRVRAGVRLVRDLEAHRHERLRERDADERDAVLAPAAEVGPQRHAAERADIVVRAVDRRLGDVAVPGVVAREDRAAADGGAAGERVAAGGCRRRRPRAWAPPRASVLTRMRRTFAQRLRRHARTE